MKLTNITVAIGTTFNDNVEQYRNHRIDHTRSAQLEPGDNEEECMAQLWLEAHSAVNQQRQSILARREMETEMATVAREARYAMATIQQVNKNEEARTEAEEILSKASDRTITLARSIIEAGGYIPPTPTILIQDQE